MIEKKSKSRIAIRFEIFFEIRRYFSKIACISADTAVNFLRTTHAPLL